MEKLDQTKLKIHPNFIEQASSEPDILWQYE